MKHFQLICVTLTTILFLSVLTSGVMGSGTGALADNQTSSGPTSVLAPQVDWAPPAPAYKVIIASDDTHPNKELIYGGLDGIYQLDYTYLQTAGLSVETLDPRSFRMFYMGEDIPIQVEGEADGSFDAGDAVLFYGQGVDSMYDAGILPTNKYTDANIYWLTYGGVNGARMVEKDGSVSGATADAFLHSQRMETNYWYWSSYPFQHNADHWYWDWMQALGVNNAKSREYDFTINHLASGTQTGFLTVSVLGYADGPHHLNLYVNDNLVFDDSTSWADFDAFEATASVPQANFVEGNNTIKVEIVNDVGKGIDKVYTNWLKVSYYDSLVAEGDALAFGNDQAETASYSVSNFGDNAIQVYDVSDYQNVQHIDNTTISVAGPPYTVDFGDTVSATSRYLALTSNNRLTPYGIEEVSPPPTSFLTPTDLLDPANGADYIVITHADFWDEAFRLADYRDREYRAVLVDVQQIYDQFNGGLMSAESIHDFLEYAHTSWTQPQPMFVVLIGDGTSDMRNYKYSPATYVPPYLYLIDGDPDVGETASQNQFVTLTGGDFLPDMHIGRLLVNDLVEAQAMVDKIIAYERQCQCDSWNYETLFVADDKGGGGGDFYYYSDRIADGYVPRPLYQEPKKIYLGQTCFEIFDIDLKRDDAKQCRADFVNSLNTDGALFVSWVGHSTKDYWGAEHIIDIPDAIDLLDNGPCLPFSIAMTCYEGSFHDPTTEALAEHAVRMPEDGFIASWSPTGFGLAPGHDLLEEGLMLALLHDDVFELGAAITQAKEHLHAETAPGLYDDLILTFILLGDPALKPKTDAVCSEIPTAVRLESYELKAESDALHIAWRTASETDILGFNILRRPEFLIGEDATQAFETTNAQIMLAQWAGLGMGADYAFIDTTLTPGLSYQYKLEVIGADGMSTYYDLGNAIVFSEYQFPINPEKPISR